MEELNEIRTETGLKTSDVRVWFKAARTEDFPVNGGACVRFGNLQIAVFNFARRNEWYACQNQCPHKMQMILSRGMIGSHKGEPKVACPYHKKTFSLRSGDCLNAEEQRIKVYPVKIEDGFIHIGIC